MASSNYLSGRKEKACEFCHSQFIAKETRYSGYQLYCPTCVKKKVWMRQFLVGRNSL